MKLTTEDLILDSVTLSDKHDLIDIFKHDEDSHHLALNMDDGIESLVSKLKNGIPNWGIYEKKKGIFSSSKGKLIGLVSLISSGDNEFRIGFSNSRIEVIVNPGYRRKSVASASINKIVDHLIKAGKNGYVAGCVSVYNFGAVELLKNLNFRFSGINRNGEVVFYKAANLNIASQIDDFSSQVFVPLGEATYSSDKRYRRFYSGFPEIETERLVLTKFNCDDGLLYQSLINQHDIADEFKGPISNEMADNLCRYSLPKAYYDQDYITWAIKEKKTGLIIGMRDLYTDSPDQPVTTQGFISQSHRGNGFHQEGLKAAINLTEKSGFSSLQVNCSHDNDAIKHILDKFKFNKLQTYRNPAMPWMPATRESYKLGF
jgi:RimJ/RimL family protein N-acetyltransferase